MSLQWNRTSFDKGYCKVFHILPYSSTAYSDLAEKYGADYVFKNFSATAENAAFTNALGQVVNGRNDILRVYPGTYTFAAGVTVAKGVTIESATGNMGDVIIDLATSDVAGFVVTGTGVTIRNMSFTGADSGTTIAIASTGTATTVENCLFACSNISAATVDLDGDASVVRNCIFGNAKTAIQVDGSRCVVENNMIYSANTAAVGIELTGSTAGKNSHCLVRRNIVNLQGGTGDIGIKVAGNATGCALDENVIGLACNKDIVSAAVTDAENFRSYVGNTSAAGLVGGVVSTS